MNVFNSFLVSKYIAHRGYHNSENPENSLGAFQRAIEKGFAIELDVRAISDGTVVVFHDDTLSRMTGKDGYVANLKKSDLKKINLSGTEFTIPTFKETLKLIAGKAPLLIEIKNDGKVGELEKEVLNILKSYKGEFAIQSFNPYVLMWFKENAPEIMRGQLSSFFKDVKLGAIKKSVLKKLKFNKLTEPHFITYKAEDLPNRYVKKYSNIPLIAWTIRSEDDFFKTIKYCDNMIFENFDINETL